MSRKDFYDRKENSISHLIFRTFRTKHTFHETFHENYALVNCHAETSMKKVFTI